MICIRKNLFDESTMATMLTFYSSKEGSKMISSSSLKPDRFMLLQKKPPFPQLCIKYQSFWLPNILKSWPPLVNSLVLGDNMVKWYHYKYYNQKCYCNYQIFLVLQAYNWLIHPTTSHYPYNVSIFSKIPHE